ncbi:MAG: hypothetical protein A2W25_04300 [candidate division Zixibacteria bacterium RBG_16_53_22]|nr:MAG: hypothetical protein A2W25_04300 [candidate division Zixibacteria bacterium RBG_16_53_22]
MAEAIDGVAVRATDEAIGRISWFSVRSFELDRETLLRIWAECGLTDEEFLPETRAPDAFKAACKVLENRVLTDKERGIITRYLVRHEDGAPHIRHAVVEYYQKGQEKPFAFIDLGRFTYGTDEKTIKAVPYDEGISKIGEAEWNEVVRIVKDAFAHAMKYHNDVDVRQAVQRKLRHWHSLLLRPTGGVYFIPALHGEVADKYAKFLRAIGSEMWSIVVAKDPETIGLVRDKLADGKAEAEMKWAEKREAVKDKPDEAKAKVEADAKKEQDYWYDMDKEYEALFK